MSAEVFLGGFGVRELAGSIAFYALVAVGEELLFRGYVISVLRKGLGEVTSILIAAAVFTSMHVINPEYYWFAFVYAFLMGILLGFVFVRRTTLWTVMGFHFAWDTLQSDAVFNFPERGGEAVFAAVLALNVFAARYLAARSRRVGARSNLREGGARWQR
jgi:membrane protease YdiL (CAAX protease family)